MFSEKLFPPRIKIGAGVRGHAVEVISIASPHTPLIPAQAEIQQCNRRSGNFHPKSPLSRISAE